MAIELNPIASGYSTGKINDNFQKVEDELNNNVLRRNGLAAGEANQMEVSLDMNSNDIMNVGNLDVQGFSIQNQSISDFVERAEVAVVQAENSATTATTQAGIASTQAQRAEDEADRAEAAANSADSLVLRGELLDGTTEGKGAELVSYDAGTSVKDKLTELIGFNENLSSDLVGYDPTISGLIATDVKAAIDELASLIAALTPPPEGP